MLAEDKASCGCFVVVLIVNLLLGAWSVNVVLALFDKVIPFIGAVGIGLFAGQVTIPIAVIVSILKAFNVIP